MILLFGQWRASQLKESQWFCFVGFNSCEGKEVFSAYHCSRNAGWLFFSMWYSRSVLSEHKYNKDTPFSDQISMLLVSGHCYSRVERPEAEIIQCCSPQCRISLFHVSCLQLQKKYSKKSWYCPDCRKNPMVRMTKRNKKRKNFD